MEIGEERVTQSQLDPSDLERLVELRFLLETALTQGRDTTTVGRHAAVILLDGVNESALSVAVQETERNFWRLMTKARSVYSQSWEAPGRKGVEDLHRARNLVQHHGIATDPTLLSRWAAETERFVRSLVDAAFGVELRTLVRADAVVDSEIRALLRSAEQALYSDKYTAAITAALEALEVARRKWRRQWDEADPVTVWSTPGAGLRDDDARGQLARLVSYTEMLPFATDLGEFVWLRGVERATSQNVPVSSEDASRAVSFVFSWIMRWEAFSLTYTAQRIRRWLENVRPPLIGEDDHPIVLVQEVVQGWFEPESEPRFEVRLVAANPPIDDARRWRQAVEQALSNQWGRAAGTDQHGRPIAGIVHAHQDGGITFSQVTAAHTELIPQVVVSSISDAVRSINEETDAQKQWEAEAAALETDYRAVLGPLLEGDPSLLDDLSIEASFAGGTDKWLRIALGGRLESPQAAHMIRFLDERLGKNSLHHLDDKTFEFRQPPPTDQIVDLIWDAAAAAERALDVERSLHMRTEAMRVGIEEGLHARLKDLQNG